MKILLTGGSGFIGKNILESFLAKKHEIIAPKRAELDLTVQEEVDSFFEKNKIDVVIHTAAKPGHRNALDPANIFFSDMLMFMNLMRGRNCYKKIINLSSGASYDTRYYHPKIKEDDFGKHIPIDEHGLYRYVSGKFMEQMEKACELRVFGIFGKYEDYTIRFISNAICKTIFGLPITIKQDRKFDYIFIDDLMPVLDYFIDNNGQYNVYNITPDNSIRLSKLASIIKKIAHSDAPVLVKEIGLGIEYSGDNSRLKNEINGINFTPIEQAVQNLYMWYSSNQHLINYENLLFDR